MSRATRRYLTASLAVALGSALLAQDAQRPPARSPQDPIRAGATFVRVDVYPTRRGVPVSGLTAAEFEIREDGVLQEIQTFEHVVVPTGPGRDTLRDPTSQSEMLQQIANPRARVVAVFLDAYHVDISGSHYMIEPLVGMMRKLMGPEDLVGVMTPGMAATHVVFARKSQAIEHQLRKHWDWGQAGDTIRRPTEQETLWELCYPPPSYPGVLETMVAKSREAKALEAMQDLVRYLGGIREERKAIVVVSNGWRLWRQTPDLLAPRGNEPVPGRDKIVVGPTGQPTRRDPRNSVGPSRSECDEDRAYIAQLDNQRTFRDLLEDANRANASFYPVDPRGLVAGADHRTADRLRELADNTQGLAVVNSNDLDAGVTRVVRDLTSYYLIGYTSRNTRFDGEYRRIQVRVKQPNVKLRHRLGYRAPSLTDVQRQAEPGPAAEPDTGLTDALAELSRAGVETRFRISAAHITRAGEATIWLAGEISAPSGAPDEFLAGGRADLEIQAGERAFHASADIEPGQRGFVTSVTVPAAGLTDLLVRGRVSSDASAEPLAATLATRLGPDIVQPLVFRRGPTTGNRLVATSDRRFSRTERLHVELPVDGATRTEAARLLDKAGAPLKLAVQHGERVDEQTGQRWITTDLSLAALAAGDYAIELSLVDGDRKRTLLTAFRVAR